MHAAATVPHRLGSLTSPEVAGLAGMGAILAVPLGSTEQHGPHLPLATDTDIALALCDELATRSIHPIVVAPAVSITASGEHAGFAGTLSIGCDVLELLLVEVGRSATETFDRVLVVNAHGGNAEPLTRAIERLRYEGRDVRSFTPRWDGDAHAGHVETSLQLALDPAVVRVQHVRSGDLRPLSRVMAQLSAQGVGAVSATGVLGDPTTASAGDGLALIEEATGDLGHLVERWLKGELR